MGDPLTLPQDQADVKRVLRYILRGALPLKRLTYVERTGQVHYQGPTYAGYFANALGHPHLANVGRGP